MDFLEKDLEGILFDSPQETIRKKGLDTFRYDKIFRQVNFGVYGRLDLLTINSIPTNKFISITVYELKNKKLNSEAFWQTVRYVKAVKDAISFYDLSNHHIVVDAVMIGRELDTQSDFCFIPTIESCISIYTYQYTLDGLFFKQELDNYHRSNFKSFDSSQLTENLFSLCRSILNKP